jgi:hypothetical protein
MKTKSLILALAGALFLTACDNTSPASNPVTSGDPASSSEVPASASASLTEEEISAKALEDLVAKLATPKQKMELFAGNDAIGEFYYTDRGYIETYQGEQSGAVLNSQGWFQASVANGAISLEGFRSFDKTTQPYYWGKDIADLGKDVYTADPSNPKRFTSTNADLLSLGGAFVGVTTAASALTVLVDDAEIVYGFTLGSTKVYLTFSEFGTASNAALDAFLASPKDKVAPTSFSATEFGYLTLIMGPDATKVPFPSFATFAYDSGYSSNYNTFYMVELNPAANALETYSSQLLGKGFTKDEAASKTNDYYFNMPVAGEEGEYYCVNIYAESAAEANSAAAPNGYVEIDITKKSANGGADTLDGVAADVNNVLTDLLGPGFELEYKSQYETWYTGIDFGNNYTPQQIVTALASYMPDYILGYDAGLQDPSAGGEDIFGDGTVTYLYIGFNAQMTVMLQIIGYVENGSTYVDIYLQEAPSLA